MADFYLYANETGNLDLDGASKHGGSAHFGFGTAVFGDRHGDYLWRGLRLRAQLEGEGVRLPKGFHAVNDSTRTRTVMFDELKTQAPRIDATLLLKSNVYDYVRNAGEMRLYSSLGTCTSSTSRRASRSLVTPLRHRVHPHDEGSAEVGALCASRRVLPDPPEVGALRMGCWNVVGTAGSRLRRLGDSAAS